jgi:drug/metabolite transporter (DMT)-like permease
MAQLEKLELIIQPSISRTIRKKEKMNDTSHNLNQGQTEPDPVSQSFGRRGRILRGERHRSNWVGGALLILLGVFFLVQSMGGNLLNNWWAFFILLPAIAAFETAWRAYQDAGGRLTYAARGSLIGGFLLVCVAAIFFFSLDWALYGPVLIILAGVAILVNFGLMKE